MGQILSSSVSGKVFQSNIRATFDGAEVTNLDITENTASFRCTQNRNADVGRTQTHGLPSFCQIRLRLRIRESDSDAEGQANRSLTLCESCS